jgi:hypothetical protein
VKKRKKHECGNLKCTLWNKQKGSWRTDVGQKGGGKGWCGRCLKAEDLERRGFFRDDHYNLYFNCLSCHQAVRVRKEDKKKWM